MRELSLAQKAMLNGSVCPYCKAPSTMINTVEGKQVGCEKCGAWMRSDPFGKPMGRLAKPDLLRSMDMAMTEINIFAYRTKRDVQDIYKSLSGELDIQIEHVSPYKMSLPSLLNTMRYIKKYSDNHIRIYDRTMVKKACPRHGAVVIGSNACHGCPEFLFHVANNTTDTVVCDMDMSYGDRKKDKYEH